MARPPVGKPATELRAYIAEAEAVLLFLVLGLVRVAVQVADHLQRLVKHHLRGRDRVGLKGRLDALGVGHTGIALPFHLQMLRGPGNGGRR